jgi:hypothetical protein
MVSHNYSVTIVAAKYFSGSQLDRKCGDRATASADLPGQLRRSIGTCARLAGTSDQTLFKPPAVIKRTLADS